MYIHMHIQSLCGYTKQLLFLKLFNRVINFRFTIIEKTFPHEAKCMKDFFIRVILTIVLNKVSLLEDQLLLWMCNLIQCELRNCHASAFMLLQLLFIQTHNVLHPQYSSLMQCMFKKLRLHAHTNSFTLLFIFHSCIHSFTTPIDLLA